MTEDEAIERLRVIHQRNANDPEGLHGFEDELLIEIIRSFGWSRFVEEYTEADVIRWYA